MAFGTVLKDLEDYLDWNRFMLLGLIFWALLVALVVDNDNVVALCSEENPFLGVIWIVGLVLMATTCLVECLTDVRSKKDKTKLMVHPFRKQSKGEPRSQAKSDQEEISKASIGLRFISNLLVFYTIVAISSYSWFPVGAGATCFVPWTQRSKDWSLMIIGIVTVLVLIARVLLIDYITKETPKSEAPKSEVPTMAAAIAAALQIWENTRNNREPQQGVSDIARAALSALRTVEAEVTEEVNKGKNVAGSS